LIELLGSKVAPPSKRRYARRKSVGEFTAGLGQQGGAKHVPVVGMLKRPRAAFRNVCKIARNTDPLRGEIAFNSDPS